jgi:DNA-binding MarR family transcriptional regulator
MADRIITILDPNDVPAERRSRSAKAPLPPVRRALTPLARRLVQICTAAAAARLADEGGLVPLDIGAMANLSRQNGEPDIDQNSLAGRLSIDRYSASLMVDRLEEMGIVERRVNGADRRARLLRLTQRGERLYARLRGPAEQIQMNILAPLSPKERELFIDLLARVVEANRALARPGAGRRKPGSRKSG